MFSQIFAHCSSMLKYRGGVRPRMPRRSFSAMLKPVPLLYIGLSSTSIPRFVSECITCTSCSAKRHLCTRLFHDEEEEPPDEVFADEDVFVARGVSSSDAKARAPEGAWSAFAHADVNAGFRNESARRCARWRVIVTAWRRIASRGEE